MTRGCDDVWTCASPGGTHFYLRGSRMLDEFQLSLVLGRRSFLIPALTYCWRPRGSPSTRTTRRDERIPGAALAGMAVWQCEGGYVAPRWLWFPALLSCALGPTSCLRVLRASSLADWFGPVLGIGQPRFLRMLEVHARPYASDPPSSSPFSRATTMPSQRQWGEG